MESIGETYASMADIQPEEPIRYLELALGYFDSALSVFDPVHTNPAHKHCSKQRAAIELKLKRLRSALGKQFSGNQLPN